MDCWLCIRLYTVCAYADSGRMLEHIPGLPDLILFWMNDVLVIRVSRCGITRGTLYGQHVLTFIWVIMIGGSFKIVSNWAVLTGRSRDTMVAGSTVGSRGQQDCRTRRRYKKMPASSVRRPGQSWPSCLELDERPRRRRWRCVARLHTAAPRFAFSLAVCVLE